MSFQLELDPKSEASSRFLSQAVRELQAAFVASGLRQQEVAEKLNVDRSSVNRKLQGKCNLTLRSIAELGWAIDAMPRLVFDSTNTSDASNRVHTTVCTTPITTISVPSREPNTTRTVTYTSKRNIEFAENA